MEQGSKTLILKLLKEEERALRSTIKHIEFNLKLEEDERLQPIEEEITRSNLVAYKKEHAILLKAITEFEAL